MRTVYKQHVHFAVININNTFLVLMDRTFRREVSRGEAKARNQRKDKGLREISIPYGNTA